VGARAARAPLTAARAAATRRCSARSSGRWAIAASVAAARSAGAAGGAAPSGGAIARPAHGGVERAGGDAHAAAGADQVEPGGGDLRLDAEDVGLGHGAGVAPGLGEGEMALRAREVARGDAEKVLGRGGRVEGGLDRQPDVGAGGRGVGLGAAKLGAGGVEAGPAPAEVEERDARGEARGPVVERPDQQRQGLTRDREPGGEERAPLPAVVARAEVDCGPVGRPRLAHALAGRGDAGAGGRDQRVVVGGAQAVVESQGRAGRRLAGGRQCGQGEQDGPGGEGFHGRTGLRRGRHAQLMVLWKRFTANVITARPMTRSAAIWGQRMSAPTPLRKTPRMMTRK